MSFNVTTPCTCRLSSLVPRSREKEPLIPTDSQNSKIMSSHTGSTLSLVTTTVSEKSVSMSPAKMFSSLAVFLGRPGLRLAGMTMESESEV